MTNIEFLEKLELAHSKPNLYATGAFGAPTGVYNNNDRYYENTYKNVGKKYADKIIKAPDGTFLFDCIGLGKGIVYSWSANPEMRYGGAIYKYNDIPDFSIKSLPKYCEWVECDCVDYSRIQPGEWLRTTDNTHVAYYLGDGWIMEMTTSGDGVIRIVPISTRKWNGHGKLNYIEYVSKSKPIGELTCPYCGKTIKLFADSH